MAQKMTPQGLEVGLFVDKPKPIEKDKASEAPKVEALATKRKTK